MTISLPHLSAESVLSDFESLEKTRASTPEWLKSIQKANLDHYTMQSFPTRKTEHWKYNDVSSLTQKSYQPAQQTELSPADIKTHWLHFENAIRCVFVNGKFSDELSSASLNDAVRVTEFTQATSSQVDYINQSFEHAQQNKNLFISLNAALANDGLLIEIDKNANIEQPIYLLHIFTNNDEHQISNNHTLVYSASGSQAKLVEHFISLQNSSSNKNHLSSQQTLIQLAANSHLDHHRVSTGTENLQSISRVLCRLAAGSQLTSFYFSEGGLLDKTDIDIMHQGSNSSSQMTGIYLPSEQNNIDFHTCIEHQVPHCTSRETFRGIIADSAKATFNGKIHIFKDAQKSDAQLNNKNLLLTNTAEINTKPELEIYADDVVCAHGATIAKIDEKAVYYLKTRGINEMQAKKMLSIGFINELLQEIKIAELQEFLASLVQKTLANLR